MRNQPLTDERRQIVVLRATLQNLYVQVLRRVRGFRVRTFVAAEFDRAFWRTHLHRQRWQRGAEAGKRLLHSLFFAA